MEWISVKDRLPENTKSVLGTNGKVCYVVTYTRGGELDVEVENDKDSDQVKYDEKRGEYCLTQGWYECEETPGGFYDEQWVSRSVIAWMPLPDPPSTTI